jgi:two-component system, LytTR family, response regulator
MSKLLPDKISAYIIDDEQHSIDILCDSLRQHEEIELVGASKNANQAKKQIIKLEPELLFLDVEMPCLSGFELLREIRENVKTPFFVIFYTAYEKYVVQALRESAFDFILKPLRESELKNAIDRIKEKRDIRDFQQPEMATSFPNLGEIIALPAPTGLRFLKKNEVALLQHDKKTGWSKSYWYAILFNQEIIRLKSGLNSTQLFCFMGHRNFVQVNQSVIVNLNYVCNIEIKTRQFIMLPPFANLNLVISRNCMTNIRERFEVL